MLEIFELFDGYSRQARLFPGLLTVFPPLLTLLAWFPELLTSSIGATLLTFSTSCGLLYMLASFARTRGKVVEVRLLKTWGGWPTTIILRHADNLLDPHTKQRYHHFLSNNVLGLSLPTQIQERKNTKAADKKYESAIKWLKERTRKEKFPLIEKENAQYGFRRNLLGMKLIGIISCVTTLVIAAVAVLNKQPEFLAGISNLSWMEIVIQLRLVSPILLAAMAINLIAIGGWIFLVRDRWVEEASYQYAIALLASCDKISQQQVTT